MPKPSSAPALLDRGRLPRRDRGVPLTRVARQCAVAQSGGRFGTLRGSIMCAIVCDGLHIPRLQIVCHVSRFAHSFVLSFIAMVVARCLDVSEMIYVKRRCPYVSVAPSCNTVGEDVGTGSSAPPPPPPSLFRLRHAAALAGHVAATWAPRRCPVEPLMAWRTVIGRPAAPAAGQGRGQQGLALGARAILVGSALELGGVWRCGTGENIVGERTWCCEEDEDRGG